MGVVMGITAAVLGIAVGLLSLVVWAALLFPRPTERAGMALERRPGRCFLTGLLLAVAIGGPAVILLNAAHGLAKLGGWSLLTALAAVLVIGFAAMAQLLGERLRGLSPAITPLGGLVRGALTVELAMLPPFLGWFVFAPLVGITMLGAGVLGCARPRRHLAPVPQSLDQELTLSEPVGMPQSGIAPAGAATLVSRPAELRSSSLSTERQDHAHAS